jgi:quaternary ammonium compound-resistance protein SugE
MAWVYLIIAGCFEISWTVGLKYTQGFTRFWPSVLTGLAIAASMFFLAQAVRTLPIGTGYAVWTGIGVVGTAACGIVLFAESAALGRLVSIALIVIGIIGLRLTEL